MLGITDLYPVPQQLQGFAQDDAYSMTLVNVAEVLMGVDGKMSSGYIPQIKEMDISLQADSDSNNFFEAWYSAQEAGKVAFSAFGVIQYPAIGRIYTLTNGVLFGYTPISDAKKILQPRKFQIKWESVIGAPI